MKNIIVYVLFALVLVGCASNNPLIIKAAGSGDLDTIKRLQNEGQNINEKDSSGATPLMYAIWSNKPEMAKYLIESGADTKVKDLNGYDALMYALDYRQSELANILLDENIDTRSRDSNGSFALHYAVENKNIELINKLLTKGVDIESKDSEGRTPLLHAVSNVMDVNVFKKIASASNTITPRQEAFEVVKLLMKKGANVNATNDQSVSVLEFALTMYNVDDVVTELINAGANLFIPAEGKARLIFIGEEFFRRDMACVTIGEIYKYLAKDIKIAFVDVKPGSHKIEIPVSWYQKKVSADITVEAGQTYYLEITQNISHRYASTAGAMLGAYVGGVVVNVIGEQSTGKGAFFIIPMEETEAKEKIKALLLTKSKGVS